MSKPSHPSGPKPAGADKVPQRRSGRVQFDERGQAIWEWAVETGMFDRNASTQRVRALSESAMKLELAEVPGAPKPATVAATPRRGDAVTPYARAATPEPQTRPVAPAAARPAAARNAEPRGGTDPYSRGPAKRPESVTFNPYDRTPPRRG